MGLSRSCFTCVDRLLTFKVPMQSTIHNYRLGAVFRASQAVVVLSIAFSMYHQDSWAYKEMPEGAVGAWLEYKDGKSAEDVRQEIFESGLPSYCDRTRIFAWDNLFNYDKPHCMWMHLFELMVKQKNHLKVVTSYIELRETAWVTGGPDDAQNMALCEARNGTLQSGGAQRRCLSRRTVYPIGVEHLVIAFEHFYKPVSLESPLKELSGSSSVPPGEQGSVDTIIKGKDGKIYGRIKPGRYKKSVEEWLGIVGVHSLDSLNPMQSDHRDESIHPPYRTTGFTIDFTVSYDNRNPSSRKPDYLNKHVFATIHAHLNPMLVEGASATDYSHYPRFDAATGAEIYDKTMRYSMFASFRFRSEGWFYIFDWVQLYASCIGALVMLHVVQALAVTYASSFHPRAKMLRNATLSRFDISDRLGVIGLKGALTALDFQRLDPHSTNKVDLARLVSIYSCIENMTFEQAYAVAHLVMNVARRGLVLNGHSSMRDVVAHEGSLRKFISPSSGAQDIEEGLPAALDFDSVLFIQEGQDMISWASFLQIAEEHAAPLTMKTSDELRSECLLAYQQQQQQLQLQEVTKNMTRDATVEASSPHVSIEEELRALAKTCSELKVSLDNQVACQSRALENAMEEIQAKFENMFENERNEVRKSMMAMQHMGISCSRLMHQTAVASTQLTMARDKHSMLQTPARGCSQEQRFATNSKTIVCDVMKNQSSSDSSKKHSQTASSPLTTSSWEYNGNLEIRLLHLEECVARLADSPGHNPPVETSVDSQHSQGQGLAHEAIPRPSGIYEDIVETARSLPELHSVRTAVGRSVENNLLQSRSRWRKQRREI